MGKKMRRVCLMAILALAVCWSAEAAASRAHVAKRLEAFRQFFTDFQFAPDYSVPGELLAQCHGVIIMREYKAGFVFGVRGGDGVVLLHDPATGRWSAPGFIVSGEGSFGFQIGGQSIDAIILIMNRAGVDMLLRTRFKIGVDAAAAAGPVGRNASAKVGPGTALLAYSRAKGLYAGVAFEGGAMLNNNEYNRAIYGRDIGLREILLEGQVATPPEAQPLIDALTRYSVAQGGASHAARGSYGVYMTQPQPAPVAVDPALQPLQPLEPLQPIYPESYQQGYQVVN